MNKINTAVLGATGVVGQVFTSMLAKHEIFNLTCITASDTKTGTTYGDIVNWTLPLKLDKNIAKMKLSQLNIDNLLEKNVKIVFSALPTEVAKKVEPLMAEKGLFVFSNASAMRYKENVPIIIPEANLNHLKWIEKQGYPEKGFVITNANCSTTGLAAALAPLRKFNIEDVFVSTYQSISGAGYPGLSAMDINSNIIPFINSEEDKMKVELNKILDINVNVYPFCVRVPILFGHLEAVSVKFKEKVNIEDIKNSWKNFKLEKEIPSLKDEYYIYNEENNFPQTKLSFQGKVPGMPLFLGRLKKDNDRFGFILLVNNIVKGAAGGSIANAEAFYKEYLCN